MKSPMKNRSRQRQLAKPNRSRKNRGWLLGFEPLEDRRLLALVTWDGGGGDDRWENAANWTGDVVPGAMDDAQIDVAGSLRTIVIDSSSITVRSLNSQENLQVKGTGNFTINSQSGPGTMSLIAGGLQLASSRTLNVIGSGTSVQFLGASNIDGASLYVNAGGSLQIPALSSYTNSVDERLTVLQATGAGSTLDLRNVTSIIGATNQFTQLRVEALDGGKVDLRSVATITDPADANPNGTGFDRRSVRITADGVNSQIDLSLLTTIVDRGSSGDGFWVGPSSLSATTNGTVLVPLLASVSNTNINVDATGRLALPALSSVLSSTIEVNGGTFSTPQLSNIDGVSIYVQGGGSYALPTVTSYTNSVDGRPTVLQATGAGSALDLRNVTSIIGATNQFTQLRVEALDGGKVDLRSVATITDPADANPNGSGFDRRSVRITADGANSQIDLSLLTTIVDRGSSGDGFWVGPSSLSATTNGTVLVPLLASVSNTDFKVDATGTLALPALSSALSSTIEVNGSTFSTPQLSNIDGVSIYVQGGGSYALPTVTSYTNSVDERPIVLQATGAGSTLDLRNVTSIIGAKNQFTQLRVEALDGGKVDLRSVATITDPADANPNGSGFDRRSVRITADGANSQIDLSLLTTIVDRGSSGDGFWVGTSLLSATNNGAVLVPILASVSNTNINVDATGRLALPALSSVLSSTVEVNGGTFSTPQLSNVDGVSIYVRGGGSYALPTVTSYTNSVDSGLTVLQATGAGSTLDLRNVTSIIGAKNQFTQLRVEALDGGKVDLRSVATITDPADANPNGSGFDRRSVRITADGVNSQIDLSLLTTIVDRGSSGDGFWVGTSLLSATNNGAVLVPILASVSNTNISVDATGRLALPALSSVLSSTVEVNGGTFSTPQLSNVDGVSIYVRGGGSYALPTVTSYTNSVDSGLTVLQATGAGSTLDLRNVTSIIGATNQFTQLRVEALDGGKVDLRSVATITDPADANPNGTGFDRRSVRITADGVNSQIDLSLLTTIVDRGSSGDGFWVGPSSLSATNNGAVLVPILASVSGTAINIDSTGNLNITSLQAIVNGAIYVTEKTLVFPNVVDVRGSSIETFANAQLTFPLVREFDVSGQTIRGQIGVPILNTITMTSGTVNIALPAALDSVTVGGGEWVVSGPVLVQQAFHWTGGSLRGAGSLVLDANVAGVVDGSTPKSLGLTIENRGRLVLKGANIQFGLNGDAGILKNLSGKTLSISGDIDLVIQNTNAAHSVINEGNLARFGTGETRIDVPVTNTGSISVQQGSLNLNGNTSMNLNGSSFVGNLPGTTLRVAGSFTGNTFNADSNFLAGGLTIAGGTLSEPLQFELMGADVGIDTKGFQKNFSVSKVLLDNAYVKLRDAFDNQVGAGPESLYVDTLIVPAGSTLDLNNLKVYARSSLISGIVIGGEIQSIPDGGSLQLNAPSFGSIASEGQVDAWSFFGRVGQKISLTINPGSLVEPSPVSPVIGFALVELVAPNGDIIASASNSVEGQPISLVFDLTSTGNHTIRVKAPLNNPTLTGNYLLTGLDASIDIYPLVVNQQVGGIIENGRSVDRWTFGGLANQQVALRVASASFNGAQFTLSGPSGFVGFTNLLGDSELITLPSNGVYQIEVDSAFGSVGNYAFTLEQTSQLPLQLNTAYAGTTTSPEFTQLFSFDVDRSTPVSVLLQSVAAQGLEMYLRRGVPPTRQKYDFVGGTFADTQSILVPIAASGKYYILLYGRGLTADAEFTLNAESRALLVTRNSPSFAVRNSVANLSVAGLGFLPGTTVELVSSNNVAIAANSVNLDSTTQITAKFDLNSLEIGKYDLRVSLPDGTSQTKPLAFEVLPPGVPKLETRLILPPALGRVTTATIYVEYANTGTSPMAAPQLTLRSADLDDSDKPLLTLDASKLVAGFWTSARPEGFSHSVHFAGNGAVPGTLSPGERVQLPVYYAGLLGPWDMTDNEVEFQILVSDETDTSPIDWAALSSKLKPNWISAEAWPAVYSNLQSQIGSTWGDYYKAMNDNASYLSRLGQVVSDQSELWSFELQQALGYSPVDSLASATDAAVIAPGLSLTFGRNFGTTLPQRFETGIFGRGWIAPWQIKVTEENNGIVVVSDAAGSQRRFQPDRRLNNANGEGAIKYFGGPGETGSLIKSSGYRLVETNGMKTWFRSNGTLEYVEDPNGNRITTTFADGKLIQLTHSSGASLSLTYNAAGRVVSIVDSVGRATTYGYDANSEYLLTVTTVRGTVTYAYNTSGSLTQMHTLKSITDGTGVTKHFEYNTQGRLAATYMGDNVSRFSFSYDAAGMISTTDAAGAISKFFVDHRGLVVRQESSTGYYVNYTFDRKRMLQKTTDAMGRTESYTYSFGGATTSIPTQWETRHGFFQEAPTISHRRLLMPKAIRHGTSTIRSAT
jgi:YD repeat-containing protein